MSWGWREIWVLLGVRTTWDLLTVRAACTLQVDTLHSRGQHQCVCIVEDTLLEMSSVSDIFLVSALLCFRHDGYGQQYPGMPYGMHPSGMYPQQQVRAVSTTVIQHSCIEGGWCKTAKQKICLTDFQREFNLQIIYCLNKLSCKLQSIYSIKIF